MVQEKRWKRLEDEEVKKLLEMIQAGNGEGEIQDKSALWERRKGGGLHKETIRIYKRAHKISVELHEQEIRKALSLPEDKTVIEGIKLKLSEVKDERPEINDAIAQKLKDHWDDLSKLAEFLLKDLSVSRPFCPSHSDPNVLENRDGIQLLNLVTVKTLDNPQNVIHVKHELYPYLLIHLKQEFPEWEANMMALKKAVVSYYLTLCSLDSKTLSEAEGTYKVTLETISPLKEILKLVSLRQIFPDSKCPICSLASRSSGEASIWSK